MLISGKQAFVGGVKYDSPKNDCVGGYFGPRYRKECLPYVTVLKLGVEKSDCLKE